MASKHPVIRKSIGDLIFSNVDEDSLKLFIKRIPAAVAVLDNHLRFIIVSERFLAESGLEQEDVLSGGHWYDIVPDIPKKWKIIHARTLQGEHLKCEEDIFFRADNSQEWWRWESLPWYNEEGTIGGLILNVENITRQKQIEKNLKHTIKSLNESNRALARFAHICAHDLNEPLRTITNYVQLLKKVSADKFEEPVKSFLNTIVENTHFMNTLVRNLLDYSQIRIRKIKLEDVSLNATLNHILKSLKDTIHSRNAEVNFKDMPCVTADASLIRRVFENLIVNAIKFNINEVPVVQISAKDCNHFWLFSIDDNGIGIEARYLNRIFVEFMRLNPKNLYDGSGIGLAQCKKIIEDHNGRIWARSTLGQGSTFFFTLPKSCNL